MSGAKWFYSEVIFSPLSGHNPIHPSKEITEIKFGIVLLKQRTVRHEVGDDKFLLCLENIFKVKDLRKLCGDLLYLY